VSHYPISKKVLDTLARLSTNTGDEQQLERSQGDLDPITPDEKACIGGSQGADWKRGGDRLRRVPAAAHDERSSDPLGDTSPGMPEAAGTAGGRQDGASWTVRGQRGENEPDRGWLNG
jgi:hypothetical protein